MLDQTRTYEPLVGPFDPCPPMRVKTYPVPPQLYLGYQPYQLPQFPLPQALRAGTLWPVLYSPYAGKPRAKGGC
jgi:spore coat protein JA